MAAPADYREREYLSLYATEVVGLVIHKSGVPADADGDVTLNLIREDAPDGPVVVFSRIASHVATGTYEVLLGSEDTGTPGLYTLQWLYQLDAVDQEYRTYAEVGQSTPDYDMLAPGLKQVVDSVWIRIADLYDHPTGGPHLQTYFQTHFGRGRIAQLMRIALGKLNTVAQPHMTYTLDDGQGGATFPVANWGPLLESGTWIEVIKHLRRSYVEQPNFMGSGAVSRLDRRDYMQRWGEILGEEEETFKSQMETFKIAHMGFGRPKVLVSGGIYGRYGPTRLAGSVAARPRYWTRFYTVFMLLSTPWLSAAIQSGGHDGSSTHMSTSGITSIVQVDRTHVGPGLSL